MQRSFQSRLGRFHDPIRRKLIDNNISLAGQTTDCIRIRLKKTKQGDIESRVIEESMILPILFPPLKDVPYRRLTNEADPTKVSLEVLPALLDLFPIEIMTAHGGKIRNDDLLFRVLLEPDVPDPLVLALQVQEPKGTWGSHSLIYSKFDCTIYNETLPQEVLSIIAAMTIRRETLGW